MNGSAPPVVPTRERIEQLVLRALGRPPRPPETDRMLAFLKTQAESCGLSPSASKPIQWVWAEACHLVFLLKESIHVP